MEISISDRTPFKRWQYIAMAALVLLGVAVGGVVWYSFKDSNKDVANAFGGGALTLFFGTLLGGIVSLLVAELHRVRVHRAASVEYITNILADLKAVYDKVDRGRTLIAAHQSAKTYGDEMRNFIEARVKLLQVVRALKFDQRGSAVQPAVESSVKSMEGYLPLLIEEFTDRYKDISRAQSVYEARMASLRRVIEQGPPGEKSVPEPPANEPWDRIAALEQVQDFLKPAGASSGYRNQFLTPLDSASSALRIALEALF